MEHCGTLCTKPVYSRLQGQRSLHSKDEKTRGRIRLYLCDALFVLCSPGDPLQVLGVWGEVLQRLPAPSALLPEGADASARSAKRMWTQAPRRTPF